MKDSNTNNLFEVQLEQLHTAPLAARMRPRNLNEFVGQEHIIGAGRLLRRAIQADQLSSLIFYGPPGTGKTTLAKVIAGTTKSKFTGLNAVLAGVKQLRDAIDKAEETLGLHAQKTILFVDEVHRWNKAQQDALLPSVENGTIILIGATTENPYFEVIKPLVSRSRIFQLQALNNNDLIKIVNNALQDTERGLGKFQCELDNDALEHLVNVSNGDARSLLNALELAVITPPASENNLIRVTLSVAEESIQQRAVLYDKEGDAHYDTISAFIKSLRGSDADASLYWLAKMVYAGEDPRYIFRRMLILAAEDIGLADPQAIQVITACATAFEYVGLPEGQFHLAEAALYLATAPKSNTTLAFYDALSVVEKERENLIPNHLRDGNRDSEGFGHGSGYKYPHAYSDHWVAQQYLPKELQGRFFYQPSKSGYELKIGPIIDRQRETIMASSTDDQSFGLTEEILTNAGTKLQAEIDHWIGRANSDNSNRLSEQRDRVISSAKLKRHSLVLDLYLGTGFFTSELIRHCPEGGVWSIKDNDSTSMEDLAFKKIPETQRPIIVNSPAIIEDKVRFDAIVGRNIFRFTNYQSLFSDVITRLSSQGRLCLSEEIVANSQQIYELMKVANLNIDSTTYQKIIKAELTYYEQLKTKNEKEIRDYLNNNLQNFDIEISTSINELLITKTLINRWFPEKNNQTNVKSYAASLKAAGVTENIITVIRNSFTARLEEGFKWHFNTLYVVAIKK